MQQQLHIQITASKFQVPNYYSQDIHRFEDANQYFSHINQEYLMKRFYLTNVNPEVAHRELTS